MCYKLKYSSLLSLKLIDQIIDGRLNIMLIIKGPLGINILKIPSDKIVIFWCNKRNIIFLYSKNNKQDNHLSSFISIFLNSCRTVIFGDLIGLNLKGLGLKFLSLSDLISSKNKKRLGCLVLNLGYSKAVKYYLDYNYSIFFLENNRNILCYSTDFSYIRNKIFFLIGLKKPDRYKKKGFSLVNKIF
jgi:hypothetical protein